VHRSADAPAGGLRIVSLVPSLTELLCELGLGGALVGRTGFCIHPRELLRNVPKVGGTKDVDVERIRSIAPTHLVVNVDENEKPTVERLAEFVPEVIVTHPIRVEDNRALIARFGELFGRRPQSRLLEERFDRNLSALRTRDFGPVPVVYLIWKDPWMTIGPDTFIASMLEQAGMRALSPTFDGPARDGAARYPVVDLDWIRASGARAVLLSSEPFRFRASHAEALGQELGAGKPQGQGPVCTLIDGEMTSWYGSRAIEGLSYLLGFRRELDVLLNTCPGAHA
jgi:ABC-type Fe3+-hydroxamate transport system substrate-binding protein